MGWSLAHTLWTVSYILWFILGSEKDTKLKKKNTCVCKPPERCGAFFHCQQERNPKCGQTSALFVIWTFFISATYWTGPFLNSSTNTLHPFFHTCEGNKCLLSNCTPEVFCITEGTSLIMPSRLIMMGAPCVLSHRKHWVHMQWRSWCSWNTWKSSCLHWHPYTHPVTWLVTQADFLLYHLFSKQRGQKRCGSGGAHL